MSAEPRFVRTLAFVPAHDGAGILEAAESGVDALCLDLEDLIPGPLKRTARGSSELRRGQQAPRIYRLLHVRGTGRGRRRE